MTQKQKGVTDAMIEAPISIALAAPGKFEAERFTPAPQE